jgi:hypothetical protein
VKRLTQNSYGYSHTLKQVQGKERHPLRVRKQFKVGKPNQKINDQTLFFKFSCFDKLCHEFPKKGYHGKEFLPQLDQIRSL